jgi:hypothetical protein
MQSISALRTNFRKSSRIVFFRPFNLLAANELITFFSASMLWVGGRWPRNLDLFQWNHDPNRCVPPASAATNEFLVAHSKR